MPGFRAVFPRRARVLHAVDRSKVACFDRFGSLYNARGCLVRVSYMM